MINVKRKYQHKSSCNNENSKDYNYYVYQFIRLHGGWNNWNMVQIEEYPCKNKREAEARETYWMKELKSTLNSHQSFLSEEDRKEYHKEYQKEYQKTDKQKQREKTEKRKKYKKQYQKQYMKQWMQTKRLYLNELKSYNI